MEQLKENKKKEEAALDAEREVAQKDRNDMLHRPRTKRVSSVKPKSSHKQAISSNAAIVWAAVPEVGKQVNNMMRGRPGTLEASKLQQRLEKVEAFMHKYEQLEA
jgi:hypothetical protein